jgi:UDPglucose 6-dehydrogenase
VNVTIIGTGHVGLVSGACLAELGNSVVCLDADAGKVRDLQDGRVPVYEPGLEKLLRESAQAGRLSFTTDAAEAIVHGDVLFIAAGTPADENGEADLQYVLAAARDIGKYANRFVVVANKSTVPIGTAGKVREVIAQELAARQVAGVSFSVVSNPEFLREGAAVEDFMRPDRIVLGVEEGEAGEQGLLAMRRLYAPLNRHHEHIQVMDVKSSEFTKYAANAMLATRISLMNELANLAEKVGADIELVRRGVGSDSRIGGSYLHAGAGYGGSCLPKDVQALTQTARKHGRHLRILEAVQETNAAQKHVIVDKMMAHYGGQLTNRVFGLWGLAFKPDTDDMREAPSRVVINALLRAGARIQAHDPVASAQAQKMLRADLASSPQLWERISFAPNPQAALEGADALVIMTEWKAYRSPDLAQLKRRMKLPVIFDGRNLCDPKAMRDEGVICYGIGRQA